jgi:hypothetical protein
MTTRTMKAIAAAALIGIGMLWMPAPAEAGHGGWGAGLVGFGIGAIVGTALVAPRVYEAPPPPPPPAYYGPAAYGPPPWTPDWIAYCAQRHPSFNPNTGYFYTYSGQPIFCQ